MAKDQTRRMNPAQLETDKTSFAALQAIAEYAPANTTFSITAIGTARAALEAAQVAEAQTAAAAAAARDNAVAREWQFHNLMLGAKDQVVAQFGRDSNEVQSLGLKKASEYSARKRTTQDTQPTS
ncbi:MAG TPA: hypothetical protein VFS10_12880 [Pyrinomonadaceae bacterium]|nr:hypothetical protein [Pyrinomonadaceae bacterium]